jgi:hypothetical protein
MSGGDWVSEVGGADEGFLAWELNGSVYVSEVVECVVVVVRSE